MKAGASKFMPSPFQVAVMMSRPPIPPGRSDAKYRSPLLRTWGKNSSEALLMPGPMLVGAPHSMEASFHWMYHKSRPPCPPCMSLTKMRNWSSGVRAGWPTCELSSPASRSRMGSSSAAPQRFPARTVV